MLPTQVQYRITHQCAVGPSSKETETLLRIMATVFQRLCQAGEVMTKSAYELHNTRLICTRARTHIHARTQLDSYQSVRFRHALQPWTHLDITLRSCMRDQCLNQSDRTLSRLSTASFLEQSLWNDWDHVWIERVIVWRIHWNQNDANV